jgi:hypothetical protein
LQTKTKHGAEKNIKLLFSFFSLFCSVASGQLVYMSLLGPVATGTGTITLYPTFESFTLGELVSLMKVFRLVRLKRIFLVFKVWTQYIDVQHLNYWQGQHVYDALLLSLYRSLGAKAQLCFFVFGKPA